MREPDYDGVAKVWRINRTQQVIGAHRQSWGYADSSLADWIVHGPYHPLWSWWYVGVVHLRDIPGAPPPHKQYTEAEYEIMCLSLNPNPHDNRPSTPDLVQIEAGDIHGGLPGFLTPPDWVVQFDGVTDEQAVKVGDAAMRAISRGQSCDSDFRAWWTSAIKATAQHFADGIHG